MSLAELVWMRLDFGSNAGRAVLYVPVLSLRTRPPAENSRLRMMPTCAPISILLSATVGPLLRSLCKH